MVIARSERLILETDQFEVLMTLLRNSIYSSDARVVRASTSGALDSGLVPSQVKPITLIGLFTVSLLDAQL